MVVPSGGKNGNDSSERPGAAPARFRPPGATLVKPRYGLCVTARGGYGAMRAGSRRCASMATIGRVETELVLYPGEAHAFLSKGTPSCRADAARRIAEWTQRFCRQESVRPQPVSVASEPA